MSGQPWDMPSLAANPGRVLHEPAYEPTDEAPPWPDDPAIGGHPDRPSIGFPRPVTGAPKTLATLDWSEIMAEPDEPAPTIATGIPKIGLTVLAGSPKVGKSLYLTQTALTVGRSLLVFEEGSRSGIAYRLRRQAAALGIAEPDLRLLHLQHLRLDNRAHVRQIRDVVAEYHPVMVGFDPLNRLHGADENRPSQMTPVMDALAGIAYDFACSVTCVHHLGKPSMERRGDIWDRFRGASSIRSGTDSNLILDTAGDQLHLVGEFRDAEPLSQYLTLDRDSLTFSDGEPPAGSGKIDRTALLALIRERGQVTAREVCEAFRVTKHTALDALDASGADSYAGMRGALTFYLKETR